MIYFLKTFQLQIKLQEQIQIWLILQKKEDKQTKKMNFLRLEIVSYIFV